MARYRSFRDFDWPLLIVTLIICALGVLQIYSATHDYQNSTHEAWWKQILYIFIALGVMWIAASIDYHTLMAQTPILYGISIAALVATFVLGKRVAGGRRPPYRDALSEHEGSDKGRDGNPVQDRGLRHQRVIIDRSGDPH